MGTLWRSYSLLWWGGDAALPNYFGISSYSKLRYNGLRQVPSKSTLKAEISVFDFSGKGGLKCQLLIPWRQKAYSFAEHLIEFDVFCVITVRASRLWITRVNNPVTINSHVNKSMRKVTHARKQILLVWSGKLGRVIVYQPCTSMQILAATG